MKKYLMALVASSLIIAVAVFSPRGALISDAYSKKIGSKSKSIQSVLKTVTGTVTLLARERGFPEDCTALYQGRDDALAKQKVIKVSGTNTGASTITLQEVTGEASKYTVTIPVPAILTNTVTSISSNKKATLTSGNIDITFGSGGSVVPGTGSVNSVTCTDHEIARAVAARSAKRGSYKGTFVNDSSAKNARGRFKLNFSSSTSPSSADSGGD